MKKYRFNETCGGSGRSLVRTGTMATMYVSSFLTCYFAAWYQATICCILVSHPPPAYFIGTRFADHCCIFYRPHALYASMLLIYMLVCYSVNCKTAKRCKILERLHPDFTSFTGSVASRVQELKLKFFVRLANKGTNNGNNDKMVMVMAAHPHEL